ncbi:RNA-directed DNA polymerase, eukaryota [Tanacetum coccineum]
MQYICSWSSVFYRGLFCKDYRDYSEDFHIASGFGFDPITNDYKIATVSFFRGREIVEIVTRLQLPLQIMNSSHELVLLTEHCTGWQEVWESSWASLSQIKRMEEDRFDLLGGNLKRDWIKELVEKNSPSFFGIQETKSDGIAHPLIRSLWPGNEVDFVASGSVGASGGILTMWDTNVFSKESEFINRSYVGIVGSWSGMQGKVGILNVYAPQDSHLKEELWSSIELLLSNINASWIVFGDFNVVRFQEERNGSRFNSSEANSFNDFISRCGLFDFPHSQDSTERALRQIRDSENRLRDDLNRKLMDWDVKAEEGSVNDHDISKREEWIMDLLQIDRLRNEDLKQKCRFRWAVEGDENSRFFHSILNNRYAKYSIKGIHINGCWIESPGDIKQAALNHYAARFKESSVHRPLLESNLFRKLSAMEASLLESDFSIEEVKDAVWDCAGSKAPGPDGFNFTFIKAFWDVLKFDFWNCIRHFEITGALKKGCNPSFMVLIPKKIDPIGFSDYRPISLIGCVYKVISKLLASRLAKVIGSVISPNQSAFIKGRQILDGCLIANEIIRMAKLEDQSKWVLVTSGEGGIASCLSSASISVLVNGSPSNEFLMERGLRQGDPLSPLLFLIVAEALQVTILNACDIGIFKGVRLSKSNANISLLQFADDALFFGEWSGIGCLQSKNLSLLAKWKWRFLNENNSLWCTVIEEFYGEDGGFHSHSSSLGCSGVWVDIIKAIKHIETFDSNFRRSFVRKVAYGADTFFWLDPWCDDGLRLKDKFPRLYALESIKNYKVKDRGHVDSGSWTGSWAWRIPPRGRAIDDLNILSNCLNSVVLNPDGCDKWVWSYSVSGHFKVNTLSKIIENNLLGDHSLESHHKWNYWIPKKVNIVVWKASLDRLATCSNLMARGIVLPTYNCPFCGLVIEDSDHVLVRCQKVCGIRRKMWSWWSLPPPTSFPPITLWATWNWRNRLIHATGEDIESIKMEDIFPSIQWMAKLWMSARISSKLKTDWNCWVARPFDLFS